MTEQEQQAAKALASCTFLPGSPEKRFARDVCDMFERDLTERQKWNLWRLVYRFRRQIDDDMVELAQQKLAEWPEEGPPRTHKGKEIAVPPARPKRRTEYAQCHYCRREADCTLVKMSDGRKPFCDECAVKLGMAEEMES